MDGYWLSAQNALFPFENKPLSTFHWAIVALVAVRDDRPSDLLGMGAPC
jgi:hypothetical protein